MEFSRRKWGQYLTLIAKRHFKVKLLYFKSGLSCSMQRHSHRRELWCFLFGYGIFSTDKDTLPVCTGDSVEADKLQWHQYKALSNTLVLEIQTGTCVESDIERK